MPEATQEYISEIELTYGEDDKFFAASSIVPPNFTVSYWHDRWRKENFGDRDGNDMWKVLELKIPEYEKCGVIVKVQRNPYAVAIVTPIMQRAHQLASSSEIIFVDSTSSVDEGHHVMTFLFAKCPVGAVPVGVLITNGQSEINYCDGFMVLKEAIGNAGFNGHAAPAIFMTDDSDAERNALSHVWPSSSRLLCLFHISQAVWRWLRSADNGIDDIDRKTLMRQFREIIYATTVEEAEAKFSSAYFSATSQRYQNWLTYIRRYWDRRELWCLAYRKSAALRGCHTNNFVEVAIRLFKDIVLTR